MIALTGFMAVVLLVLLLAPESPAGRAFHRQVVERPLQHLADMKRHHLIFFAIILGLTISGGEAFAILGPHVATSVVIDMAIYLDAVLVAYAVAAVTMVRQGAAAVRAVLSRMVRRPRPRRKRPALRKALRSKPANDDHPAPVRLAA